MHFHSLIYGKFNVAGFGNKNVQSGLSMDKRCRKWNFLVGSKSFFMVISPITMYCNLYSRYLSFPFWLSTKKFWWALMCLIIIIIYLLTSQCKPHVAFHFSYHFMSIFINLRLLAPFILPVFNKIQSLYVSMITFQCIIFGSNEFYMEEILSNRDRGNIE